jgi:very-short-patch-repair endonuclease
VNSSDQELRNAVANVADSIASYNLTLPDSHDLQLSPRHYTDGYLRALQGLQEVTARRFGETNALVPHLTDALALHCVQHYDEWASNDVKNLPPAVQEFFSLYRAHAHFSSVREWDADKALLEDYDGLIPRARLTAILKECYPHRWQATYGWHMSMQDELRSVLYDSLESNFLGLAMLFGQCRSLVERTVLLGIATYSDLFGFPDLCDEGFFRCNEEINGYRVAFGCALDWDEKKVAVEVIDQPRQERTLPQQHEDDLRERKIVQSGWTVVRFYRNDIEDDLYQCARRFDEMVLETPKGSGELGTDA